MNCTDVDSVSVATWWRFSIHLLARSRKPGARFPDDPIGVKTMDRRKFLKTAGLTTLGTVDGRLGLSVPRGQMVPGGAANHRLAQSSAAVSRDQVALLADVHHGPFVPLAYIRHVVAMTNALKPDIVALVGDFVHREPAITSRRVLTSWGNSEASSDGSRCVGTMITEDYHGDVDFRPLSRAALAEAKLPDLNNHGIWIERQGARLRICGVGDLWTDHQNLDSALGDATDDRRRCPPVA